MRFRIPLFLVIAFVLCSYAETGRPNMENAPALADTNIGIASVTAAFSNYGRYLLQMLDSIQSKWTVILRKEKVGGRGLVKVRFELDSGGHVVAIRSVKSEMPKKARDACAEAVVSASPLGGWSDSMKASLGDRQELTLVFHYQ